MHLSMRPSKTAKTPEEPDRQHFLVKAYSWPIVLSTSYSKNMNLGNLEAGLQWYLVDAGTNASHQTPSISNDGPPSQHVQETLLGSTAIFHLTGFLAL